MVPTTISHLLRALHYDASSIIADQEAYLNVGATLSTEDQSRASTMTSSQKFSRWITTASSLPLLVNGNADLEAAQGPSPLSFVAAKLLQVANLNANNFNLAYFCALHGDDPQNPDPVATLMGSLIGHLLSQMRDREIKPDLCYLEENEMTRIKEGNLEQLCIVFRNLVNELPEQSAMFCVLDELSFYETSKMNYDTNTIVRRLTRLLKRENVVFKLLITRRGRSLKFHKSFQAEDILDLNESVELDDGVLWVVNHKKLGNSRLSTPSPTKKGKKTSPKKSGKAQSPAVKLDSSMSDAEDEDEDDYIEEGA